MQSLGNIESLQYYIPELVLCALGMLVLIVDLLAKGRAHAFNGMLTLLSLAVVAALVVVQPHTGELLFFGMVRADALAQFFKLIIAATSFATVLVAMPTREVSRELRGEFYMLMLFVTFGMFLMVSASNLLTVYLGIETSSISSYILAGFLTGQTRSSEAAFKYVIYGAVASGVMLFGVSLIFGMAGTTDIMALGANLQGAPPAALTIALVFIFAGLGYKIASVPFHMWSPDVYEGSPIPITAFLSVASKAAGFGVIIRFFRDGLGDLALVEAMDWPLFVAIISAVTMTVGNLAAFGQKNIKRLLAYSSIAHGGYLLMGVVALGGGSSAPVSAMLFYLVVYLFMNLGGFYVVLHLADPSRLGSEEIADYRGLIRRSPMIAILMSIFLFSLVGLPPFAGFWGKLYLFKSVVDASMTDGGVNGHNYIWLVVLGLLNSAISLYYYFAVVKAMLLDSGDEETPVSVQPGFAVLLLALFIPTLLFGFVANTEQGWIRDFAQKSVPSTPAPESAPAADTSTTSLPQ